MVFCAFVSIFKSDQWNHNESGKCYPENISFPENSDSEEIDFILFQLTVNKVSSDSVDTSNLFWR